LLVKVHHALIDGLGGLQLARSLLDRRRRLRLGKGRRRRAPRPAAPETDWHQGLQGAAHVAAEGPLVPPGPFVGWVGGQREFATANLSMDDVHSVKTWLGVSADDVLLAAIAGGLERYLRESRVQAPESVRAMVPASTRGAGASQGGVHVTSIFVDLPLDSSSLTDRARRISVSKAVLRSAHAGLGFAMLAELAGRLPAPLHESVVRLAGGLPVANLVVSDVPGPLDRQFFLGRAIEAGYPLLPLPARIGVSIAAIRLGGTIGIGITADPRHLHNAWRLATSIEKAMSGLLKQTVREGGAPMPRGLIRWAA
jgi:diacylglycerol O-acyltransferase